jgi:hypothetical protein
MLNVEDCARVIGVSDKQQEFTIPFGAALTAPAIKADYAEKIDCAFAINPSITKRDMRHELA